MGQTNDRVHRCSDLMAHIGEEGTFSLIGGFSPELSFGQFGGTLFDQLFQMLTVLVQLFTQLLFLGHIFFNRHIVAGASVQLANG